MATLSALKSWARGIKRDVVALWIAARDPRVPWYAKAAAGAVAAHALSLIDLIPDFIPIIGYLDDLVIVPIGILLAVRLVPPELMEEFRQEAIRRESRPKSLFGAAFIAAIWIGTAAFLIWLFWPTSTAATPA
ncbi:YkvA family protein [Mesorhizobium sp. M0496]|uniref:YkvA family protein n=1 Tax=Mesorhizobium sp. M0496 TaxID=2956952 RepID=UPI003335527D